MPRVDYKEEKGNNLKKIKESKYDYQENKWNNSLRSQIFGKKLNLGYAIRTFKTLAIANTKSKINANFVKARKATDLDWLSEKEKQFHLFQHKNLSKEEYSYYEQFRSFGWKENYSFFNGVAQGSPLSPTLSTIVLVPLILNSLEAMGIFYADDGILYSNKEFNPSKVLDKLFIGSGIAVHPEGTKRKWIKFNGKWLSNLKFLGKEFVPFELGYKNLYQNGILKNSTRTPKPFSHIHSLAFGWAIEFDHWFNSLDPRNSNKKGTILDIPSTYTNKTNNPGIHNSWIDSEYFGYITSRIYLGQYDNLDESKINKKYEYVEGSWSDLANRLGNDKANLYTASSFSSRFLIDYLTKNKHKQLLFKNKKKDLIPPVPLRSFIK